MKILKTIIFTLFILASTIVLGTDDLQCCLDGYLELLNQHPHLKQSGSFLNGEIEIVTDKNIISEIVRNEYQRLVNQKIDSDTASKWSCPGIVYSDPYLLWVRDPVIFPNGKTGLFKRIIWRCTLNQEKPVAVLPLSRNSEIGLVKIWRHATGSWELELPRGAPNLKENPVDNALRELKEETGFVADEIINLGLVNPDSGVLSTNISVFIAFGTYKDSLELDEDEVISGVHTFTLEMIEKGLKQGYLEITEKNTTTNVYLRDPFLTYALYQAKLRNLL